METPQVIPKVLYQTCETSDLPPGMRKATETWKTINPEYEYHFFDDATRRKFIEEHFNEEVNEAYNSCVPGAYRSDIWRYCVLYINGGVYVDAGTVCIEPLSKVIAPSDRLIVTKDRVPGALANGFIASAPKERLIGDTIALAVKRVLAKDYGDNSIYPTGPYCLGDALNQRLNRPAYSVFDDSVGDIKFARFMNSPPMENGQPNAHFCIGPDTDPVKFALYRYEGIETERKLFQSGTQMNYGEMWIKRICF